MGNKIIFKSETDIVMGIEEVRKKLARLYKWTVEEIPFNFNFYPLIIPCNFLYKMKWPILWSDAVFRIRIRGYASGMMDPDPT